MSIYNKNIIDNEFKPDFLILIQEFPELKKYIIKEGNKNKDQFNFDWSNNELSLLMTKSILNYYFNIKYYDIPKGYLIPPVPSRLNYINFINILLNKFNIPKNEDILGIDIGTGANIIYPLIGNSLYNWKFICSEINLCAYENADNILSKNNLKEKILLLKQNNKNNIFIGILNQEKKYIFSMCNPPYYDYENEIKIEDKKRDSEYNFDEVYYKQGEYGFFLRYFEESICYKKNIFINTILIGKKINAEKIYDIISENKEIKNKDIKKIKTGSNVRYILYWSFYNNYSEFKSKKLYSKYYNNFKPIVDYN